MSIQPIDVKPEMVDIKQEMYSEWEDAKQNIDTSWANEDDYNYMNTSASIKEEYGCGEHIAIKEEPLVYQNGFENVYVENYFEDVNCKNEIDIKEDPLFEAEEIGNISWTYLVAKEGPDKATENSVVETRKAAPGKGAGIEEDSFGEKKDIHINDPLTLHACAVCKKEFTQKWNLDSHMRIHTGVRPFECQICKDTFAFKCTLDLHMRIHSTARPLECNVCKKKFNTKENLTRHMLYHSDKRPYKCEVCKKSCISKSILNLHMQEHNSVTPFQCVKCMKKFGQKVHLDTHMLIHSQERLFECNKPVVTEQVTEDGTYKYKINIVEDPLVEPRDGSTSHAVVVSEDLDKATGNSDSNSRKDILSEINTSQKNIVTTDSERTQLTCEICMKKFSRTWNLYAHVRSHALQTSYKYIVEDPLVEPRDGSTSQAVVVSEDLDKATCNSDSNSRKDILSEINTSQKNIVTTDSERTQLTCEICMKKFSRTWNLYAHMRSHALQTSYKCNICKSKFPYKSSFDKHMQSHEKSYKCNICKERFTLKAKLYRHMETHSGKKPLHECDVCKKKFTKELLFRQHIKTH